MGKKLRPERNTVTGVKEKTGKDQQAVRVKYKECGQLRQLGSTGPNQGGQDLPGQSGDVLVCSSCYHKIP